MKRVTIELDYEEIKTLQLAIKLAQPALDQQIAIELRRKLDEAKERSTDYTKPK